MAQTPDPPPIVNAAVTVTTLTIITRRDYFAGQALQGILAGRGRSASAMERRWLETPDGQKFLNGCLDAAQIAADGMIKKLGA